MDVKRSLRKLIGLGLAVLGIIFLLHMIRGSRPGDRRVPLPRGLTAEPRAVAGESYQALLYDVAAWSFSKSELARLDDHVGEMSRVGFIPVTVADVRQLLYAGHPLPTKAVLLLFSGLQREQLELVQEVMERRRWTFAVTLDHDAYKDVQMLAMLNSVPTPSWSLGMRWDEVTDFTWMNDWGATPPQFGKTLFVHRTFPLRTDTTTPHGPLVFGGMDIGYSNSDVPRDRQNLLTVQPAWVGRDLVGHLVQEMVSLEDRSGKGVAWALHSGLAGLSRGRMWLRSEKEGIPAEIRPAAPAPGRSCRLMFTFDEYPSGLSLSFAPGPVTGAGSLVFGPNGHIRVEAPDAQGALQSDTEIISTHPLSEIRLDLTIRPRQWFAAVNGRTLLASGIPVVGGLDSSSLSIKLEPPSAGESLVQFQLRVISLEPEAPKPDKRASVQPITPPPPAAVPDELPIEDGPAAIPETAPAPYGRLSAASLDQIRSDAQAALGSGKPIEALKRFGEWWMADPENVQPVERIAEILVQIGRKHEAIDFYRQALDMDPEREVLALRLSGLLQEVGQSEDARLVLNDYGRLHPDSTEILMAQAEWLQAQGRNPEAVEKAGRVVELDPSNQRAILLLLSAQSDPVIRKKSVARLIEHISKVGIDEVLLDILQRRSILTIPEAPALWEALQTQAAQANDTSLASRLNEMTPRRGTNANGVASGALSSDWLCWDGEVNAGKDGASVFVQARPTAKECTLRTWHSDRWLDGFVEVEVSDLSGGMWLLARKSADYVVRFGFDRQDGRLLLQTWTDGGVTLLTNQRIDLPDKFFNKKHVYRLECRGNGIEAFLDGKTIDAVTVGSPSLWQGGWFGMVFLADEPGIAGARIHRLVATSTPIRLAVFPAEISETANDTELARVREMATAATVVSPVLFTVDEAGAFSSPLDLDTGFVRLFARYHKLRYMPGVKWSGTTMPNAEALAKLAVLHAVEGLVLHLEAPPSDAWLAGARDAFQSRGIGLLCVVQVAGTDSATFFATFGPEMIPEPVAAVVAEAGKTAVADSAADAVLLRLKENF